MDRRIELYRKLSHELALKQLIERFAFEIAASEVLFFEEYPSLEVLINDCSSTEVFTQKEYCYAYDESLKANNYFKKIFLEKDPNAAMVEWLKNFCKLK